MKTLPVVIGTLVTFEIVALNLSAIAQIEADSSLGPESSVVESFGPETRITGGAERGSNLFHSFREFGVSEGAAAFFANPDNIRSIFSRVTGSNVSEIFGTLGVEGTASLFLLNPNGIVFGPNAQLAVPGSFFASTGDELLFDGYSFSAITPEAVPPILTNRVPVGLGLGSEPGDIEVLGESRDVIFALFAFPQPGFPLPPDTFPPPPASVRAGPGGQLALIGGDIKIDGGSIDTVAGSVYLLATGDTVIPIDATSDGVLQFAPDLSQLTGDVELRNGSSIVASFGGSLEIEASDLIVAEGSSLSSLSFTPEAAGGDIDITLGGDLSLIQGSRDNLPLTLDLFSAFELAARPRGIYTVTASSASGGDVNIDAENVLVGEYASIRLTTISEGDSGSVSIDVRDRLEVDGEPLFPASFLNSTIFTSTSVGDGNSGTIDLSGSQLVLTNGAQVTSISSSDGAAGAVSAEFSDILITGRALINATTGDSVASALGSLGISSENPSGISNSDAGPVDVRADNLRILEGGVITTTSSGAGSAGSIDIDANSVLVSGSSFGEFSEIQSAVEDLNPTLDEILNETSELTAFAGRIEIDSENFVISDGGRVSVVNEGTQGGGEIVVVADSLQLDNGNITASTRSQQGGDIVLSISDLRLRDSEVSAESVESGDGGNIDIFAGTIVLDNSTIQANAFDGNGGNITIVADALIQNPASRIEASSQLGIEGVVEIESPESEFLFDLVSLSPVLNDDEDDLLDGSCIVGRDESTGELVISNPASTPASSADIPSGWLAASEPDEIVRMPDGRVLALNYCSEAIGPL